MTGRLLPALLVSLVAPGCGDGGDGSSAESVDASTDASASDASASDASTTGDVATPADVCTQTCESEGWVCGSVCGSACGECPESERCEEGECLCAPVCPESACGLSDECGGLCPACDTLANCEDCPLLLTLVDIETGEDGVNRGASIELHYIAGESVPRPRTADLHFIISGPARLLEIVPGDTLTTAGKGLYRDADSGKPWVEREGDLVQVVILSTDSTDRIEPGHVLTLRWLFGPEAFSDPAPVVVRLVKRSETFAPPDADAYLAAGGYDAPVVLWP